MGILIFSGRYELEKLYDFEEECLENYSRLLTEEKYQKTGKYPTPLGVFFNILAFVDRVSSTAYSLSLLPTAT